MTVAHLQSVAVVVLLLVAAMRQAFPCGVEAQVQRAAVSAHFQSVAVSELPLTAAVRQAFQRDAVTQVQ